MREPLTNCYLYIYIYSVCEKLRKKISIIAVLSVSSICQLCYFGSLLFVCIFLFLITFTFATFKVTLFEVYLCKQNLVQFTFIVNLKLSVFQQGSVIHIYFCNLYNFSYFSYPILWGKITSILLINLSFFAIPLFLFLFVLDYEFYNFFSSQGVLNMYLLPTKK